MAVTNNSKSTEKPTKWEKVYEDEETISICKYDSNISNSGPIDVDIKYKKGYIHPLDRKKKTLGDLAKEAQKTAKQESKLKKSKS